MTSDIIDIYIYIHIRTLSVYNYHKENTKLLFPVVSNIRKKSVQQNN